MLILYNDLVCNLKRHENGLFLYDRSIFNRIHIKITSRMEIINVLDVLLFDLQIIDKKEWNSLSEMYNILRDIEVQSLGIDFLFNNTVEIGTYYDVVQLQSLLVIYSSDFINYVKNI